MSHDVDRTIQLQRELTQAVCRRHGIAETDAIPFVNTVIEYLKAVHGGQRVYIPSNQRYREYDVEAILAAYGRDTPVSTICAEHHISRRTFYRILAEASPRSDEDSITAA